MFDNDENCIHDSTECHHVCQGCRYGVFRCSVCKEVTIYPEKCKCEINQEKEYYYD